MGDGHGRSAVEGSVSDMWIDSEPADWLMMRYFLCFEPGDPNPEDRHVRA